MMLLHFKDTNKIINLDNVCYFEIDDRADDYAVFAVMRDNVGYVRVSKLTTKPLAEECFRNIVKTISEFSSLGIEQRICVFRTI